MDPIYLSLTPENVTGGKVPDRPWKQLGRDVAKIIQGSRYPANSGQRIDCEGPEIVAQCKHVKALSLHELESLALGMEQIGSEKGKVGLVVVKRRAGRGTPTPLLLCMTEAVWKKLWARKEKPVEQLTRRNTQE